MQLVSNARLELCKRPILNECVCAETPKHKINKKEAAKEQGRYKWQVLKGMHSPISARRNLSYDATSRGIGSRRTLGD